MVRDPARYWFVVVVAYFGLHTLLRSVLGQPLTQAEAEMTERALKLSWSYDGMMPLYPWLQFFLFKVFGFGVMPLALLKNLVMVLMAASVYSLVRMTTGRGWAWLASISLMLLPQIAWDAQFNISDDLLAAALAATTLLMFDLVRRDSNLPRLIALALCVFLGLLSAISFIWFLAAAIVATLSIPSFRQVAMRPSTAFAVVLGITAAATPLFHFGGAMEAISTFQEGLPNANNDEAAAYLQGLISSAALLIGVVFLSMVNGYDNARPVDDGVRDLRKLMARITVVGVVLVLSGALMGYVDNVSEQEVLPVVLFLAPAMALFLLPMITFRGRARAARFIGAISFLTLIANPVYHSWITNKGQATVSVTTPFSPISSADASEG